MNNLLDYLNLLDRSPIAKEEFVKDSVNAMTQFGLCKNAQSALLSGDNNRIANLIGIEVVPACQLQVVIETF